MRPVEIDDYDLQFNSIFDLSNADYFKDSNIMKDQRSDSSINPMQKRLSSLSIHKELFPKYNRQNSMSMKKKLKIESQSVNYSVQIIDHKNGPISF